MNPASPTNVTLHVRGSWPRRFGAAVIALTAVALAGMCLVPLVPAWPCMLFEHFRVQYAAAGLLIVAGAAALRVRGYFDVAALATLLHMLWIAPDLCSSPRPIPNDGTLLRVLALNEPRGHEELYGL